MIITIPGEPIAKARPKFVRRGKFTTTYNPQETEEGKFIAQVLFQINGHTPFKEPLDVDLYFYRSRPNGHYGTGRNAGKVKPSAPKHPTTKPDVDNYIKFVLDCLNDIVWVDDSLVVTVTGVKVYSDEPRTSIHITKTGD